MALANTRGSHIVTRRTALALTVCAAFTVGGLAVGQALQHRDAPRTPATLAAHTAPMPQRGGYGEYLQVLAAERLLSNVTVQRPIGGYAEQVQLHLTTPSTANAVAARPRGGYAEFLRSQGGPSPSMSDGYTHPIGGYAEWLQFQAQ